MSLFKRMIAYWKAKKEFLAKLSEFSRQEQKAIRWYKPVNHIRKSRQDYVTAILQGRR